MGGEDEIVRIARRLDKMVAKKNADSFLEYLVVALVFPWILICCHCAEWLHLESHRVTLGVQGWRNGKV